MKEKKAAQSLNKRITTRLLIMMLGMAVALGAISYVAIRSSFLNFYNQKAQQLVHIVADRTDWEKLKPYVETGVADEYAADLIEFYNSIKSNFSSDGYLYLFIPGDDSLTYLIEARTPDDDPSQISTWGDTFDYTEFEYTWLIPDVKAGKAHDEITLMKSDQYGAGLETWAPVFDANGTLQAMVEVDYLMPGFQRDLNSFVMRIIGVFIVLVAIVLLLMLSFLNRSVTKPITMLERSVSSYEHGELTLDITAYRKEDEIKNLAQSFSEMTHRIEAYTQEVQRASGERERIGAELNVAKEIQNDMLPNVFPAFPDRTEFDIYATIDQTREVGGDFYDFFMTDEDHIALVMADVSGKGVPASMFMAIARTLIKDRAQMGYSPAEVLRSVNDQLLEGNEACMFVTTWLAIVELSTGKGVAVNAGHQHPIMRRAGGKFELEIYRHSPAVAAMEGVRFQDHGFQLQPGDTLFVYTDGASEAINQQFELFGTDRLLAALNREPDASPGILLQDVRESILNFASGEPQGDDVTMLAFKYYGQNRENENWLG